MGANLPLSEGLLATRFQLTEEMPPGALSRIFRGEDLDLHRKVVVKAVPPAQVEVYISSLHATSALTHPASIALYDAIHEGGWLFLVQEAISGNSLSRYLRLGVPSERAVKLALQLAQALAYSHHRDVMHGDLTPTAILMERDATVRINNFGLPPDIDYFQAEGGSDVVDLIAGGTAYGDVLAVGLLLRQMLSSGELAGERPGGRQLRAETPDELAQLVRRCTAPEYPNAITDAESLVIALEEMGSVLEKIRPQRGAETPSVLRAARDAQIDMALWEAAPTVERPKTSPPASPNFVLEHSTHELGSVFTQITDPGHSDSNATRAASDSSLGLAPRLHLPTRPLHDAGPFAENFPSFAFRPDSRKVRPPLAMQAPNSLLLVGVLLLGVILFVLFFLIGYLGPF